MILNSGGRMESARLVSRLQFERLFVRAGSRPSVEVGEVLRRRIDVRVVGAVLLGRSARAVAGAMRLERNEVGLGVVLLRPGIGRTQCRPDTLGAHVEILLLLRAAAKLDGQVDPVTVVATLAHVRPPNGERWE